MQSIHAEINKFLNVYGADKLQSFLADVIPLFELYDVDDSNDWVKDAVGESDERNVRLIRTVYLLSKIANNHSLALTQINSRFKGLYKRMESIQ